MPALLKSILIAAIANTVSLAFAAWIFDGFDITRWWFVLAVVLFTTLTVVLRGIVMGTVRRYARSSTLVGGLVLTALALLITDRAVPGDGFDIEGVWTWLGVIAIVWAASVAYGQVETLAPPETPGSAPTV